MAAGPRRSDRVGIAIGIGSGGDTGGDATAAAQAAPERRNPVGPRTPASYLAAMLDIRRLRTDFDAVAEALARRGDDLDPSLDRVASAGRTPA